MKADELRRMYDLEDTYWWFVGRRFILKRWLVGMRSELSPSPRIVDVGCGTGANVELLTGHGDVTAVDAFEEALRFCAERGIGGLVQARGEALPFADGSFDLATSFEVLEHVPDDASAAAELARVLRPGGRALITVPAYPWLWSEHDVALDHQRRYTRQGLVAVLEGAGLRVERVAHCVSVLLPVTVAFRWGQRLVRWLTHSEPKTPTSGLVVLPAPVSALFALTLRLEAALLGWGLDIPWGVTLVAEASKRA